MQDYVNTIRLKLKSSYKLNKVREKFRQFTPGKANTRVIFIFGCQRSGTTLVQRLASLDGKVKLYGEGDYPHFTYSKHEGVHRLLACHELRTILKDEKMPVITIKPLHDSQLAKKLLLEIENSLGIWVFREFSDVINSHMNYYRHDPVEYIAPLLNRQRENWLSQNLPADIREFCLEFKGRKLSTQDAYGLFWIARNSIYLHQLKNDDSVLLVSYENLVNDTDNEVARIQRFIGFEPRKYYSALVNKKHGDIDKPDFLLSTEIFEMCNFVHRELVNDSISINRSTDLF